MCHLPRVTVQPANETVIAPAGVAFIAAASTPLGCPAPTVQWQVSIDGGATFSDVSGATTATLTLSSTGGSMSGAEYRAVFADRAGSTATNAATLIVNPAPTPGQQPQLFSSSSVWNQPLPANAPIDPSSPARIASLLASIEPPGPGVWINWSQYSVPVYRVPANQPTVPVILDSTTSPDLQQAWQEVPIPASAAPAPGTDASLVVYQPSTDEMWEFWQLSKQPDGFHAQWGGAMANVSTNAGYYSPLAWPTLPPDGWTWGASASSLPAIAGLMTISELQSGQINHALSVAIPQACQWFVWPAQRTDGTSTNPDCLPEGAHLRLDATLELSMLHLPPIALMIAEAMQKYGIIVHDTTNSSVSFFAEQPTDGSDPYDGPNGIFDGLQESQFLPLIPWNRLELLQMGPPCTQAPCPGPNG